jgi:hypothetical protein
VGLYTRRCSYPNVYDEPRNILLFVLRGYYVVWVTGMVSKCAALVGLLIYLTYRDF